MITESDLLTAAEAGQILGKSARTVQRLVDANLLEAVRKLPGPNGDFLFLRSVVETFAAQYVQPEDGGTAA